jgi:formamidopyrimidine-DNA glycosylase
VSLWRARIDLRRAASALAPRECAKLLRGLRKAFADGHRNAERYHTGARVVPFRVYDREGERCRRCRGAVVRWTQAQRSTYCCPSCQR